MKPRKWTKEFTEDLVKQSTSITDVIVKSGSKFSGGMHRLVKNYINRYEIDTSHFVGQHWSRGKTWEQDRRIKRKSNEDMFVVNGSSRQHTIRNRYRKISAYECVVCQTDPVWNGKELTLHMDHINGNPSDNRVENLRWLCPNCHSQTETYSSKAR